MFELQCEADNGKEKATFSEIQAREIPWTEEPGGLQSMVLPRAGLLSDQVTTIKHKTIGRDQVTFPFPSENG